MASRIIDAKLARFADHLAGLAPGEVRQLLRETRAAVAERLAQVPAGGTRELAEGWVSALNADADEAARRLLLGWGRAFAAINKLCPAETTAAAAPASPPPPPAPRPAGPRFPPRLPTPAAIRSPAAVVSPRPGPHQPTKPLPAHLRPCGPAPDDATIPY